MRLPWGRLCLPLRVERALLHIRRDQAAMKAQSI